MFGVRCFMVLSIAFVALATSVVAGAAPGADASRTKNNARAVKVFIHGGVDLDADGEPTYAETELFVEAVRWWGGEAYARQLQTRVRIMHVGPVGHDCAVISRRPKAPPRVPFLGEGFDTFDEWAARDRREAARENVPIVDTPTLLERMGVTAAEVVAAGRRGAQARALAQLDRSIPVRFDHPLEKVMVYMTNMLHEPIEIDWDGLAAAGVTRDDRVKLGRAHLVTGRALQLVLHQVSRGRATFAVRHGRLRIVTTERAEALREADADWHVAPAIWPVPDEREHLTERKRRSREKFRYEIAVDFNDTPLGDALRYVETQTGVNIYADWPALSKHGVSDKSPVTRKSDAIVPATLIDEIVARLGVAELRWRLDPYGMMMITTESHIDRLAGPDTP